MWHHLSLNVNLSKSHKSQVSEIWAPSYKEAYTLTDWLIIFFLLCSSLWEMNMQPGIKTEVKTYIRGFKQTVQLYKSMSRSHLLSATKIFRVWISPSNESGGMGIPSMWDWCVWPVVVLQTCAHVWAVWTLPAWQDIYRINTLGWCFKEFKDKVWVYFLKLQLLWRKQLTFLVYHTCKDVSLSIHLACFGFRLFCCEVGYTMGYMLWDIWGEYMLCLRWWPSGPPVHTRSEFLSNYAHQLLTKSCLLH